MPNITARKGIYHLMTKEKFTIETVAGTFLCVKVFTQPERFFLYILPHDSKQKGFFMTRGNSGQWEILYKILVDKTILAAESDIAKEIELHLKEVKTF